MNIFIAPFQLIILISILIVYSVDEEFPMKFSEDERREIVGKICAVEIVAGKKSGDV